MHRWSTPRRDSCTQLPRRIPRTGLWRWARMQHFACWAIAKRSLRWQCTAYAICQRSLSCKGRAESKVPSGLTAFGRVLGQIGSCSAGELCGWLNEAIRRVYTATALPVGVPQRLKVNFTWTVMATCILHRLAAMVLVTLDGISEWEKGAPGSRSTQRLRRL